MPNSYFWHIQKSENFHSGVFCLTVDHLTFHNKVNCRDAKLNAILTQNNSLYKHQNGYSDKTWHKVFKHNFYSASVIHNVEK